MSIAVVISQVSLKTEVECRQVCKQIWFQGLQFQSVTDKTVFVKQEADWSEERQTAGVSVVTDRWIYRQSHRNGEAAQGGAAP